MKARRELYFSLKASANTTLCERKRFWIKFPQIKLTNVLLDNYLIDLQNRHDVLPADPRHTYVISQIMIIVSTFELLNEKIKNVLTSWTQPIPGPLHVKQNKIQKIYMNLLWDIECKGSPLSVSCCGSTWRAKKGESSAFNWTLHWDFSVSSLSVFSWKDFGWISSIKSFHSLFKKTPHTSNQFYVEVIQKIWMNLPSVNWKK